MKTAVFACTECGKTAEVWQNEETLRWWGYDRHGNFGYAQPEHPLEAGPLPSDWMRFEYYLVCDEHDVVLETEAVNNKDVVKITRLRPNA